MRRLVLVAAAALLLGPTGIAPGRAELDVRQSANKLTVKQIADDGDVAIAKLADDTFQVSDGTTFATAAGVPSLAVRLLDGSSSNLALLLDSPLAGDAKLDLGDGARTITLGGSDFLVGRDLRVAAGAGAQRVEVDASSWLDVGRHLAIDLGVDADTVTDNGAVVSVMDNVRLAGVNDFEIQGLFFAFGKLDVVPKRELVDSVFTVAPGGGFLVGEGFKYAGSNAADQVRLLGDMVTIGGNATIDLRKGFGPSGEPQRVELDAALVSGKLTIKSGDGDGGDVVTLSPATVVVGAMTVGLGAGSNSASLFGIFYGTSVKYDGGDGVDHLSYGIEELPSRLTARLKDGDDVFTLNPGVVLTKLRVDFGKGTDTFENLLGFLPADTKLLHLP